MRDLWMLGVVLVLTAHPACAQLLAFPGAEGFGRFASGGRGGSVCKVVNLNPAGPGSLRACLETTGARTVVFTVGGTINLVNQPPIGTSTLIGDDVTIACQTAPGDGILIKGQFKFRRTRNVIMRYCRIRSGDVPDTASANTQAFLFHEAGNYSTTSYAMIFDHLSLGTSNDDICGGYHVHATAQANITFQHSIISESLIWNGTNQGSTKGCGASGNLNLRVSWLHNLFIDYTKRAPILGGGTFQLVNNVMQWIAAGESTYLYARTGPIQVGIVNNYFHAKPGAPTETRINVMGCGNASWGLVDGDKNCHTAYENVSNIYVQGNVHTEVRPSAASGSETAMVSLHSGVNIMNTKVQSTTPPAGFPTITNQTDAVTARLNIIAKAGANFPTRDLFDTRVINDVINHTGRHCIAHYEPACLTWGTYASGTAPTDSDGDGMPNSYETANGLNPTSAADGATIIPSGPNAGYSNLEVYLNQIVGGAPPAPDTCPPVCPTLGDVTVCLESHIWPTTQPTTATCDASFGTPKGALAFGSRFVTTGETGDGMAFSMGVYDGTSQFAISVTATDNISPSVASRAMTDTAMMTFHLVGAGYDGEYVATPFTNDSLTWTSSNTVTTPATGQVVLLGGESLQVKGGTFLSHATIGGTTVINTVGFLPDLVLLMGGNASSFTPGAASANLCLGAAIQIGGVVTQASVAQTNATNAASGNMFALVDTRYACALALGAGGQAVELSAFTSSGFTATTRLINLALHYGYIALKFHGTKIPFLQVFDSPTAPGLASIPVPGMTPEFALLVTSLASTVNTLISTTEANAFSVGLLTATQAGGVGYVAEDGSTPLHDLQSFVHSTALRVDSLVGTTSYAGTVEDMAPGVLHLDISAATTPARKWLLVGWGAPITTAVQVRRHFFGW